MTRTRGKAEVAYRVWRVDPALKEAVLAKRDRARSTTRAVVRSAVEAELPRLVAALAELGVAIEKAAGTGPVRWPAEQGTLDALRHASEWTGLDQATLLVACLRLATRRKRSRRV